MTPVGGSIAGRLPALPALRIGLVAFVVLTVAIALALHAGAIVPFLIASALAGIAQGAANSSGMRGVFSHVTAEERAGTLATIYLISYGGAALPGLVGGQLARWLTLPDVATCYVGLVVVAVAVAVVASVGRSG